MSGGQGNSDQFVKKQNNPDEPPSEPEGLQGGVAPLFKLYLAPQSLR